MVSNGGGNFPLWRRDGKELFYDRPGPVALMAVDVATGTVFTSGQPRELFVVPIQPAGAIVGSGYDWDVTADGSRFLRNVQGSESEARIPITVVLNWTTGLKP